MNRFVLILLLTVSLFLVACAPTQKDSAVGTNTDDLTRTEIQGEVTLKVTPLNLDNPGDTLKFEVILDTHTVELDMDLATLATLTTDTGLTLQPTLWDAPKGGHHAEGTLAFPATLDGKSILDGVKQLTLTISDVDNATSTFTWDLGTK
ncbi:MAG: hypothetical protein CVU44_22830 [Chloroflexi bacterium HGW-Chloroflexi-6]|jgi:hypothetical protein|nr:MAG: hypothetical protein CVU44_22830 [Chloroflexi bacterium HGW-Chloroflexi-6]